MSDFDDNDPFAFLPECELDSPAYPGKPVIVVPVESGHRENCVACHGTGSFRSYTGRIVGQCFKCKGNGYKVFATDAVTREMTREKTLATKARKSGAARDAFAVANPEAWAWINSNANFPFAVSMREAIEKYGNLTDKQLAACWRCIESNRERDMQRAAEKVARDVAAKVLDVSPLVAAFDHARNNAIAGKPVASLKIRFAGFSVSPAKATSANAGALYVKSNDGLYLGKVTGGRFFQSRECTPELESAFRDVCSDPKAAAIRYGHETGSCSCCGRELTNAGSIALGIGPICASRLGW